MGTRHLVKYDHAGGWIDHVEQDLDDQDCTLYPMPQSTQGQTDDLLDQMFDKLVVGSKDIETYYQKKYSDFPQNLTQDRMKADVKKMCQGFRGVFARDETDSGVLSEADDEFEIEFIDEPHPWKTNGFHSKEYHYTQPQREEIRWQMKLLCHRKFVSKATKHARWTSAIFCMGKKTGDIRIVFDYRKLNQITKRMYTPIPDMDTLVGKFQGKNFITTLDMKGGNWHCPVKKEDREKLGFVFEGETYVWNRMPFGLTNAPMHFQRIMTRLFADMKETVSVYIDDISIFTKTWAEHLKVLQEVFTRLKKKGIKLRADKCMFGMQKCEYLGMIIDRDGKRPKKSYISKCLKTQLPRTKTKLHQFIGMAMYLHTFLKQPQKELAMLNKLIHKDKPKLIDWSGDEKNAFNVLLSKIQSADTLMLPDPTKPFHLFTDASKWGIGGMLAQTNAKGVMQPVAYCSKVFNDTQQRWHVSEQELYAVIHCVEKWSKYLLPKKFYIHTDHKNLQTLFEKPTSILSGKLFRWAVRMQAYCFQCLYIPGKDNVVADYLSRECAILQHPRYKHIREFWDQVDPQDRARKFLSNTGGVDIVALCEQRWDMNLLSWHPKPSTSRTYSKMLYAKLVQKRHEVLRLRQQLDPTRHQRLFLMQHHSSCDVGHCHHCDLPIHEDEVQFVSELNRLYYGSLRSGKAYKPLGDTLITNQSKKKKKKNKNKKKKNSAKRTAPRRRDRRKTTPKPVEPAVELKSSFATPATKKAAENKHVRFENKPHPEVESRSERHWSELTDEGNDLQSDQEALSDLNLPDLNREFTSDEDVSMTERSNQDNNKNDFTRPEEEPIPSISATVKDFVKYPRPIEDIVSNTQPKEQELPDEMPEPGSPMETENTAPASFRDEVEDWDDSVDNAEASTQELWEHMRARELEPWSHGATEEQQKSLEQELGRQREYRARRKKLERLKAQLVDKNPELIVPNRRNPVFIKHRHQHYPHSRRPNHKTTFREAKEIQNLKKSLNKQFNDYNRAIQAEKETLQKEWRRVNERILEQQPEIEQSNEYIIEPDFVTPILDDTLMSYSTKTLH